MTRSKQTKGQCTFCSRSMTRGGLSKHLTSCSEREKAVARAAESKAKEQSLFHLVVQDAWGGEFWLHLEVNGASTLNDLDMYLRGIWLECCGHLSQFSVDGWNGAAIPMGRKVESLLTPGTTLTHIYDFGTSSETLVRVIVSRKGKPLTKHPIFLMGRNDMPETHCMDCGAAASWLCMECLYEELGTGELCDEHARMHPHENYGDPMPVVNSPRMGMCGYEGPATPPY